MKNLVCEESFRSEANILKNLKHNGIPIIYDIEEEQDAYYIIEEYIDGINLYDYVMENGSLSEELAINFGIQISEIIAYLHRQKPTPILYLDLKPQNIIINNGRLYLIDFGNSMFTNSFRKYMSGTRGYAAPEQYNFGHIDSSTDIYGIGAILYFMITGKTCVCNEEIYFDTHLQVSEKFKKIIVQCMSPKEGRIDDALLVARNLNEIIQEKIRKNEVNETKEYLMGNPLTVSVIGTERNMGATHFSLALASRLNELGIKTIYEDRSGEVIRSLYERSDKCTLSGGVYYYNNILMRYSYSQFVSLVADGNCCVVDYGLSELTREDIVDTDVVIIIAGGKPWELKNTTKIVKAIEDIFPKEQIILLWNFVEDQGDNVIPVFCEPFHRNADTNNFLDKVISKIFKEDNVYKKENRKRIFGFFARKK